MWVGFLIDICNRDQRGGHTTILILEDTEEKVKEKLQKKIVNHNGVYDEYENDTYWENYIDEFPDGPYDRETLLNMPFDDFIHHMNLMLDDYLICVEEVE